MKEFLTNIYVKCRVAQARLVVGIKDKINNMSKEEKRIYWTCMKGGIAVFAACFIFSMFIMPMHAGYSIDTSKAQKGFEDIFNELYRILLPVGTMLAVVLIGYNLCVIMSSKNQKKCDSAYTWIKAICITWLCLVLASVFIGIAKAFYDDALDVNGGLGHGPLFDY